MSLAAHSELGSGGTGTAGERRFTAHACLCTNSLRTHVGGGVGDRGGNGRGGRREGGWGEREAREPRRDYLNMAWALAARRATRKRAPSQRPIQAAEHWPEKPTQLQHLAPNYKTKLREGLKIGSPSCTASPHGGENSLRGFGEELATCCLGVAGRQPADLSARFG